MQTYIAFHALRTYVTFICIKQGTEAVVSLRIIRSKVKSVLSSDEIKAAFREFVRRYRRAVILKKKNYIVVNCNEFHKMDSKALRYWRLHNDLSRVDVIDENLKKIFEFI